MRTILWAVLGPALTLKLVRIGLDLDARGRARLLDRRSPRSELSGASRMLRRRIRVALSSASASVGRPRSAKRAREAVPGALSQISAELRAGRTIADGVDVVARAGGPLSQDFARARLRTELGASRAEAFEHLRSTESSAGLRSMAGALTVASEVGGSAASALEGLANSLRDRIDVAAEAKALSTQARWSAGVIVATPPAFLVFSAMGDQNTTHAMVGTSIGRVCLVVGLLLEVAGAAWMLRIVRAEA